MKQIFYVHDCTSNLIFLDREVFANNKKPTALSEEECLQVVNTISAAALIIEINACLKRYYYRPFLLNNSLLVGAIFSQGIWKVNEVFENPSCFFLLNLFKKYLLRSSLTIYRQNEIEDDCPGIFVTQ